jgi:hypothetical protein
MSALADGSPDTTRRALAYWDLDEVQSCSGGTLMLMSAVKQGQTEDRITLAGPLMVRRRDHTTGLRDISLQRFRHHQFSTQRSTQSKL